MIWTRFGRVFISESPQILRYFREICRIVSGLNYADRSTNTTSKSYISSMQSVQLILNFGNNIPTTLKVSVLRLDFRSSVVRWQGLRKDWGTEERTAVGLWLVWTPAKYCAQHPCNTISSKATDVTLKLLENINLFTLRKLLCGTVSIS
jgi:hypothetical protein